MADLAGSLEGLESLDRFGQRHAAAPMQQVKIDTVGAEPLQAGLAGSNGALARGIRRQHLGDQEDFIATAGDRFAHHLFGTARSIHFRRVDQAQAEIEAEP